MHTNQKPEPYPQQNMRSNVAELKRRLTDVSVTVALGKNVASELIQFEGCASMATSDADDCSNEIEDSERVLWSDDIRREKQRAEFALCRDFLSSIDAAIGAIGLIDGFGRPIFGVKLRRWQDELKAALQRLKHPWHLHGFKVFRKHSGEIERRLIPIINCVSQLMQLHVPCQDIVTPTGNNHIDKPNESGAVSAMDTAGDDTAIQKQLSDAVAKAVGVYEWAVDTIPDAKNMTIVDLFNAIQDYPGDLKGGTHPAEALPNSAETFGTYLRRGGIKRRKLRSNLGPTASIRSESQVERARQSNSDWN